MNVTIEYDGAYPNLCAGKLIVFIDDIRWEFPDYCLISGGSVSFDSDWNAEVYHGEWEIETWPKDFPEDLKPLVLEKVNEEIPQGCCGGCI